MGGHGDDVVHRQIAHDTGFNLYGFYIGLPFHFITGFELLAVHDLGGFKHLDAGLVEVVLDDLRTRFLYVETTAGSLFYPCLTVAIAVETDGLTGLDVVAQHIEDG